MNKPKVGDYVEFDICQPTNSNYLRYNAGNVIAVYGDDVIINQKEEVFDTISHKVNRRKVRNWKYDIEHKAMVV